MEKEPVEIGSAPFEAVWKDVLLRETDNVLEVEFQLPGDGRRCRFKAYAEAAWFVGRELGEGVAGEMAYDCRPRPRSKER
ncbi:MAG: hypothetical protein MZV70_19665 [Desulfobacterales bacterium]|nr:hypothetical protein [Desulfobacterales bacterium]